MAFQIMIVEDEPLWASKMEMQIAKLGHKLFAIKSNSTEALQALEINQPDLILMDVNILGEYDGVELTDMIHDKWPIPVLFITSLYDDSTFRRISRTNPIGYIQKPFSDMQLKHSIDLIAKQLISNKSSGIESNESSDNSSSVNLDTEHIYIKKRNRLEKIKILDIYYIEADGRYCQINTKDSRYLIRMPLTKIIEKLNMQHFVKTHRSFVVNKYKIKSIDLENDVIILESMEVPISRREKDKVLKQINLF